MSSNEKNGKTTELFFDLTMSDDNDLLSRIKEEESIIDTSKIIDTKSTDNTEILNTNISIDLTNTDTLDFTSFDDLVKETENLIETISATVQETAKISTHTTENFLDAQNNVAKEVSVTPQVTEKIETPIVATEVEANMDNEPISTLDSSTEDHYVPHFILEDLNLSFDEPLTEKPDTMTSVDLQTGVEDDDHEQVLGQTGAFLFNSKDFSTTLEHIDMPIENKTTPIAEEPVIAKRATKTQEAVTPKEIKQVEVAQTILNNDIPQMMEITHAIVEQSKKEQQETSNVAPEVAIEMPAQENESPDFGDLDIDNLLKKLDEISGKEMLTAVAPKEKTPAIEKTPERVEQEIQAAPIEQFNNENIDVAIEQKSAVETDAVEQVKTTLEAIQESTADIVNEKSPIEQMIELIHIPQTETAITIPTPTMTTTPTVEEKEQIVTPEPTVKSQQEITLEMTTEQPDLTALPDLNFTKETTTINVKDTNNVLHTSNEPKPEDPNIMLDVTPIAPVRTFDLSTETVLAEQEAIKNDTFKDTKTTLINIPIIEPDIVKQDTTPTNVANEMTQTQTNIEQQKQPEIIAEDLEPTQKRVAKKHSINTILAIIVVALVIVLAVLVYFVYFR